MAGTFELRLVLECSKCGNDLNITILENSNIIQVDPCLTCANKMADEHNTEMLKIIDNKIKTVERVMCELREEFET